MKQKDHLMQCRIGLERNFLTACGLRTEKSPGKEVVQSLTIDIPEDMTEIIDCWRFLSINNN